MANGTSAEKQTVAQEVRIPNSLGLHARPAMQLVDLANRFSAEIKISKAGQSVDAKSIMQVMTLAATQGTELKIIADGHDGVEAVAAMAKLIGEGFGEE